MTGSTQQTHCQQPHSLNEDFITIIAPTMAEVMDAYRMQGLAEKHYAIIHRAGRHSFAFAGGDDQVTPMFDGEQMVAATFARRMPS